MYCSHKKVKELLPPYFKCIFGKATKLTLQDPLSPIGLAVVGPI